MSFPAIDAYYITNVCNYMQSVNRAKFARCSSNVRFIDYHQQYCLSGDVFHFTLLLFTSAFWVEGDWHMRLNKRKSTHKINNIMIYITYQNTDFLIIITAFHSWHISQKLACTFCNIRARMYAFILYVVFVRGRVDDSIGYTVLANSVSIYIHKCHITAHKQVTIIETPATAIPSECRGGIIRIHWHIKCIT